MASDDSFTRGVHKNNLWCIDGNTELNDTSFFANTPVNDSHQLEKTQLPCFCLLPFHLLAANS
jgi:hypothetical protein